MVAGTAVDPTVTGFIGVLMLDTAFARVPGDAGNDRSYHRPARLRVVEGAGSPDIVRDGRPAPALVSAFCKAARALEAEGAVAITSTCGFLVTAQAEIAAAVTVPVMVSALSLFPHVQARHMGRIGIITASRQSLGVQALTAAGTNPADLVISGMEDCPAFANAILRPKAEQQVLDPVAIEAAVVAKARALKTDTADLAAIILECGNLPPYQGAIARATGLPVYSILDAMKLIAP